MASSQVANAIILSGEIGDKTVYGYERDLSKEGEFVSGKVDGTDSFYIVYSTTYYGEGGCSDKSVIVDSQNEVNFGFMAKSTQGWNKVGITVFEHPSYHGTGVTYARTENDVTSSFPPRHSQKISSFIVMKGVWALYTRKNMRGKQIEIDGKKEFGPGSRIECLQDPSDRIRSVVYLRE